MDLAIRPRIVVEGKRLCFRCSKTAVKELRNEREREADAKFRAETECAEKMRSTHAEWESRINKIENSERGDALWLTIILMAAGGMAGASFSHWIVSVVGMFIGVCVGEYLWTRKQNALRRRFVVSNPEPPLPLTQPQRKMEEVRFTLDKTEFQTRSDFDRLAVLQRDSFTCQNCGKQCRTEQLEVHHVEPRAKAGPDHLTNTVALCIYCHDREDWFDHVRAYPTTLTRG